ncbi:succinate dehydrogenase, hydrophobic membrane anchor protein [Ruegeria lacuscaerulensis]|uniref:succinate dehydrogenase, hydrophobic membrane anchor protein n=1 Tax=Ruegeria lacuscaerulensis TaxID=55218 RepID=UPI00147EAD19|nr:succinate dehydrogenase, hydrophobic membrane anchor protein [Ruegeria lacuscaerulensis]
MRYLTDRKRASGLGSAKAGTAHFWRMKVSSVALLILVPLFIFTFGPMLGQPYDVVLDYYSRPFPAIVAALTLVIGMKHFAEGAQVMLEDYTHGTTEKVLIILTTCLSYGAAAAGLFAIARIAL